MNKLLLSGTVVSLLLPLSAFAAFNDVLVDADVVLTVNGITLNVSGSQAAVTSIAVGSTDLTVVIDVGSRFKVTAPNKNALSANEGQGQVTNTCNGTESVLEYNLTSGSQVTVVITPSATLCSDPTTTTTTTTSSSGGSRSDERARRVSPNVASVVVAPTLMPTPVPAAVLSRGKMTATLSSGSRSNDVKELQRFLNTHGFMVNASGPGSPGNETTMFGSMTLQAVQKFQKQYGIVSSGTPSTTGYGRVGPQTRAKINELSGN